MATSYQESVSDTLVLTQTATANVVRLLSAENSFGIGQYVITNFSIHQASNTIEFTQSVSINTIINESVSNTLTLTQQISSIRPVEVYANNEIDFQQSANSNIKLGLASNELNLTQEVAKQGPIYVEAASSLAFEEGVIDPTDFPDTQEEAQEDLDAMGLRQEVSVNVIYNKSLTSYLNLAQSAARGVWASASNHIHLSHSADASAWETVSNLLELSQSVSVYNITNEGDINDPWVIVPASNELNLTQVVALTRVIESPLTSLTSNLNLRQAVGYLLRDAVVGYDTCPDAYAKVRSTILLTYPYVNPEYTVEVRNPQFDDTRQIESRRINRKTRGGTLIVFRDPIWPQSERLIYSFDNLRNSKKKELLEFFEISIGKEIGLLDFRNQQWRGIIITPETQVGREDRPGNSLTFEFEGVIDSGDLYAGQAAIGSTQGGQIRGTATIPEVDLTRIPPGLQADLSISGQLSGNVVRD